MVLGLCGAIACGPPSEADIRQATRDAMEAGQYRHILERVRGALADCPCSSRTAAIQDRIVAGLSRHHADLQRLPSSEEETVAGGLPFGPSTLVDGRAEEKGIAGSEDAWVNRTGWGQLTPLVERAERTDSLRAWSDIRGAAMHLVSEDYGRGVGREFAVRREHVAQIGRLAASARACDLDPACLEIDVDDDIRGGLLAAHRGYRRQLEEVHRVATRGARRAAIQRLHLALVGSQRHHGMIPNAAVRAAAGELVVPIDPGPYHEACAEMRDIVDRYWRTDDLRVRLRCEAGVPGAAQPFRIAYADSTDRAFVNRDDRTMNFGPIVTARVFAHEFGHVLGLPDFYYPVFDEVRCEYHTDIDNRDLMSNHSTGEVTGASWEMIRGAYLDPAPAPAVARRKGQSRNLGPSQDAD